MMKTALSRYVFFMLYAINASLASMDSVMGKAIQALARIGEELFMDAKPDQLNFVTMNTHKTAFATFKFLDMSFSTYEVESPSDGEPVTCKIKMKSILNIFKKFQMHKVMKVEFCKIELGFDSTKIIFKLKYKNDVTIVHALNLTDYEMISVNCNKDSARNFIKATGTFFQQVLSNFQMSDDDMNFDFNDNKVLVKNYDTSVKNTQRVIRSQITLTAPEFQEYNVQNNANITVSFKPFRSAINFADAFNLDVGLSFECGGRPAIIEIANSTFEVTYVMATVNPDGCTQSSVSTVSDVRRRSVVNANNNLTIQDQEAIENMDWDDFDVGESNSKKSRKCTSSTSSSKSRSSFSDKINMEINQRNKEKDLDDAIVLNENSSAQAMASEQGPAFERDPIKFNGKSHEATRCQDDLDVPAIRSPVLDSPIFDTPVSEDYDLDPVPAPPKELSPRTKLIRTVFKRAIEATFNEANLDLGEVLVPNSDSDTD